MLLIASVVGKRSSCFAILAIEIEAEKRKMAKLPSTLAGETGKRERKHTSTRTRAHLRCCVSFSDSRTAFCHFVFRICSSIDYFTWVSHRAFVRRGLVPYCSCSGRPSFCQGRAGRQAEEKRALLLVWFCCCCCFGCAPAICLLLSVLPSSASLFFCGFVSRLRFRCRIVNLLPANFVCEERKGEVPYGLRESSENGSSAQDEIGTSAAEISA